MAGIIHSIKTSGFIKNVATLISGKGLEAIIGFGLMPVVTRIFSPQDYGVAASLAATATIIIPLATFSYQSAIVFTKNSDQEAALFKIVLIGACLVSLGTMISLWANESFSLFTLESGLSDWFWVIPVYVMIRVFFLCLEQMLIKRREYKWLSYSGVLSVSAAMGLRLAWGGIQGSDVVILIAAYTLGFLVKIFIYVSKIKNFGKQLLSPFGSRSLASVARDYSDFPKFQMVGTFFRSMANNLPVTLFVTLYSPEVAGVYAMTLAISRRPLEMLLVCYRSVFIQESAKIQDDFILLRKLFLKHTFGIVVIGGVSSLILFWGAPMLLPWLLGPKWAEVGIYLQILVPWLFSLLLSLPAASMYIVIRKQRVWAQISIFESILRVVVILAGSYLNLTMANVLWAYSIIGAISAIIIVLIVDKLLLKGEKRV
ncbi:oligosaccharide flippase family protein [uncultured Desulfobacter sp.]|uniref:oligosaccharide flippase family protein n=1 Tax=uncultured Desulfobacter sp. TaxID=240139 RepID=UPI0029F56ABF|nr:oligosaccharide flippase family protein [uncultured Desulfobacter sp.]